MTALTSDQMIALTKDATLGLEPSVDGVEAAAFYQQVLTDIRALAKKGLSPDLPFEWEAEFIERP